MRLPPVVIVEILITFDFSDLSPAHTIGGMQSSAPRRATQRRSTSRINPNEGAFALLTLGDAVARRSVVDIAGSGIGLLLQPGDAMQPDEIIERVRFVLPIGAPLVSTAIVRHVREVAGPARVAGIELAGLATTDQRRLEAWVRGQSGPRAKERRSFTAAGPVSVAFTTQDGRVRERPVMMLHTEGCELGLERADADLAEGTSLVQLLVHFDGQLVLTTTAEVRELLRHRGRPVRALISFSTLEQPARRRLSRLLATAGAVAAR